MPLSDSTNRRMLAVRFGRLGDVVLTTGPLRLFAQELGMRPDVLVRPAWAGIFAGNPHIGRVVPFEPAGLSPAKLAARFRELAAEYAGCGLLDLHGIPRTRLLATLWRGPVARYPKFSLERRIFLASAGRLFGESLCRFNVPQRYALALYGKENVPDRTRLLPEIYLGEAEKAWATDTLRVAFGATRPVALHPFAAHALKTRPAPFWRELAGLLEAQGIPSLVIGMGEPLFPGAPGDFADRTSLRETCALLAGCRALVSGDSGPMHLGTAVGTPVLALFGPTTREWGFFPSGPRDRVLETAQSCRPCSLHGKFRCPRHGSCLEDIRPEAVLETLLAMTAGYADEQ